MHGLNGCDVFVHQVERHIGIDDLRGYGGGSGYLLT